MIKQHLQSLSAALLTIVLAAGAFGAGVAAVALLDTSAQVPHIAAAFPPGFTLSSSALLAKAAVVYDPTSGRLLYAKDPLAVLPLASLTKLMTAQIVLSSEAPGTMVTVTQADLATDGDAGDWGFAAGQTATVGDLVKIGLVASSNDAMAAAASSLGSGYLQAMNETAAQLGLEHMRFYNPTGLDLNAETSGAYGSAWDVARLAATFYKSYPQYFELTSLPTVSIQNSQETLTADATAAPLFDIPGFLAAKTGYTDLAGGNLVAIFDVEVGHPLVAVVLGSSEDGRFNDIRTLINAARAAADASSTSPS